MSDIVSSDNLVNALNSVRDDYHEHLKSIPQYEAFLLIESSTHRVFETLNGLVEFPAPAMAGEVISSLEVAKAKFKQHLTSVPEYRALLAIEKLIRDVSIDLGVAAAYPRTDHACDGRARNAARGGPNTTRTRFCRSPPRRKRPRNRRRRRLPQPRRRLKRRPSPILPYPRPSIRSWSRTTGGHPGQEIVAAQAEPDLAVSVSEDALVHPEAPADASDQQIVATQAEPDPAVPAFEHTLALAAEIASNHAMAQPELDLSALEHAITRSALADIPFAGPAAQSEHSRDPMPARQGTATDEPTWDKAPAAMEDLYDFDEPPAAPRRGGSERAA